MDSNKQTANENRLKDDESKFEDETYLSKLKPISEELGLSIEEIKERKITKTQLKKMLKDKVN